MDDVTPDRLLPRHETTRGVEIEWNTAVRKRRFRANESDAARAVIREISLAGALIEAPLPPSIDVGDRVEVKLEGHTGLVVVRHADTTGVEGRALYGVEFIDCAELTERIHQLVGDLRGNREDLDVSWSRSN